MKSQQKQLELERHRDVLLATIDYLLSKHRGSIVFDSEDIAGNYYEQQKLKTEKYFKECRLDRLRQQFSGLTKGLQNKPDANFGIYIKEKTGYDIDIFEDLRKRVDSIVEQKEIRSEKQSNDVSTMFRFYQRTSTSDEIVDKLKALLTDYFEKNRSATSGKNKSDHTEIISKVEENGVEKVTFRTIAGRKPGHWEEEEVISPDGKRRLQTTQWSDGKHASTYVNIIFPTTSGVVYGISGICPDLKAFWKDNSTIVIETNKAYVANTQCKQVGSFNDVITIEYIEH